MGWDYWNHWTYWTTYRTSPLHQNIIALPNGYLARIAYTSGIDHPQLEIWNNGSLASKFELCKHCFKLSSNGYLACNCYDGQIEYPNDPHVIRIIDPLTGSVLNTIVKEFIHLHDVWLIGILPNGYLIVIDNKLYSYHPYFYDSVVPTIMSSSGSEIHSIDERVNIAKQLVCTTGLFCGYLSTHGLWYDRISNGNIQIKTPLDASVVLTIENPLSISQLSNGLIMSFHANGNVTNTWNPASGSLIQSGKWIAKDLFLDNAVKYLPVFSNGHLAVKSIDGNSIFVNIYDSNSGRLIRKIKCLESCLGIHYDEINIEVLSNDYLVVSSLDKLYVFDALFNIDQLVW